jgi:hypothetical protein
VLVKSEEPVYIVSFKKGSCKMEDSVKTQLIKFGNAFLNLIKEDKDRYFTIDLKNYTCSDELNKNKMIGFKRAKLIIDILEKECKIDRKKVRYIDIKGLDEIGRLSKTNCNDIIRGVKIEII